MRYNQNPAKIQKEAIPESNVIHNIPVVGIWSNWILANDIQQTQYPPVEDVRRVIPTFLLLCVVIQSDGGPCGKCSPTVLRGYHLRRNNRKSTRGDIGLRERGKQDVKC